MTPNTTTTGIASQGEIQTSTSTNSSAKGRSISAVTVDEAMKSRTCSKPRRLAGERAHRLGPVASAGQHRSISVAESCTSMRALASSTKRLRRLRRTGRRQHQHDADGQRPQRLDGVVGHHAVVDVHREDRERQREQVDQQRGATARRGRRSAAHHSALQNQWPWRVGPHGRSASGRRSGNGAHEQHHAGVAGGEIVAARVTAPWPVSGSSTRALPSARSPAARRLRLSSTRTAGRAAGVDRRPAPRAAGASPCRHARRRARPAPASAGRRRAAGRPTARRASRLAMQAAHLDQAVEQRVGVDQVFAQSGGALAARLR
jgi:hypothetical protein